MINVTKRYLPNIEKYQKDVDEIYANGWITNNGSFVKKLEKRSNRILALPMYPKLTVDEQSSILDIIKQTIS